MDGKDNKIESNNLINVGGELLDLSTPRVMGIVNVNEDSFYPGSRSTKVDQILSKVEKYISEGASLIDVGGISTRPHADLFNADEELSRVIPAIVAIKKSFPEVILSIDTFRSVVAKQSVEAGADIVNDVYGGRYDEKMFSTVGELGVPYILMHSRGFSEDMHKKANYSDVVKDVIKELSKSISNLRNEGVKDIIIDPGFGFAKSIEDGYRLLKNLEYLSELDCPMLVGVSRKSMIYKKLNISPEEALNGTTILNTVAFMKGAKILRVHDVREASEIISLLN